jgi:hypothetical protein
VASRTPVLREPHSGYDPKSGVFAMFDFVLLAIAGFCQLALGVLGFRVSFHPPNKALKGPYELAFLVIGLIGLGAIVWSGIRSVNVQRVIADGVEKIEAKLGIMKVAEETKLFIQCDWAVMPKAMPPSGEIFVFEPHSINLSQGLMYGASLGKHFAPAGSQVTWKDNEGPAFGNKCEVFDYGSGPVFDVNLTFDVSTRKVIVNEGGGKSSGDKIQSGQWIVPIPKIDEGANNPFVFYFFNRFWPLFVQIDLPPSASSIKSNNAPRQSIEVVSAAHNQPIFLNPGDLKP